MSSIVEMSALQVAAGDLYRVRCGRPYEFRTCRKVLCEVRALQHGQVRLAFPGDQLAYKTDGRPDVSFAETEGDELGATRLRVACRCGASWVLSSEKVASRIATRLLDVADDPWPRSRGKWRDLLTTEMVGR